MNNVYPHAIYHCNEVSNFHLQSPLFIPWLLSFHNIWHNSCYTLIDLGECWTFTRIMRPALRRKYKSEAIYKDPLTLSLFISNLLFSYKQPTIGKDDLVMFPTFIYSFYLTVSTAYQTVKQNIFSDAIFFY